MKKNIVSCTLIIPSICYGKNYLFVTEILKCKKLRLNFILALILTYKVRLRRPLKPWILKAIFLS